MWSFCIFFVGKHQWPHSDLGSPTGILLGSHQPTHRVAPRFRSGSSRVLISTDLWGRGLDVQQADLGDEVWATGEWGLSLWPRNCIFSANLMVILIEKWWEYHNFWKFVATFVGHFFAVLSGAGMGRRPWRKQLSSYELWVTFPHCIWTILLTKPPHLFFLRGALFVFQGVAKTKG